MLNENTYLLCFSFQSGFPFDKNFDRDRERPFRSKLDDIAKRHPEFAEHLKFGEGGFPPFRSHLRDRWGAEGDPSGSKDPFEEYRRFEKPFGDRFPFTNRGFQDEEFGPTHFQQQTASPQPQQQQQPEAAAPAQQSQQQQPQKQAPRQAPVHERKLTNPTLIQSNTVDLGQKQEPVDDKRNQRSMSAPPENRNQQQRFVSTCNIPVNAENAGAEAQQSQQQQEQPKPQHQSRGGNERVIPIHVEGRDVPVIPKNVHQTFTPPPPQADRGFGHKPNFPQYFNRENIDRPFGSPTEDMFRQPYFRGQSQRAQSPTTFQKHQQAPPTQQPQQQKQAPPPPPQQQQQQQEKPAPPPQQQQQPKTAIDHIQAIQKDVLALMDEVEKFNGKYKDKQYLYLDEMLTRNLLRLDNIDTEGKENIRTARKEAIKCIQKCISILEAKAAVNSPELQKQLQQRAEEEKMEVEQTNSEEKPADEQQEQTAMEAEPVKTLEVSGVARSGTQANVPGSTEVPKEEAQSNAEATTQQQMEVVEEKKAETEVKQQEAIPLPPPPEHKEAEVANTETEQKDEKSKDKKKGKKKDKVEKK